MGVHGTGQPIRMQWRRAPGFFENPEVLGARGGHATSETKAGDESKRKGRKSTKDIDNESLIVGFGCIVREDLGRIVDSVG